MTLWVVGVSLFDGNGESGEGGDVEGFGAATWIDVDFCEGIGNAFPVELGKACAQVVLDGLAALGKADFDGADKPAFMGDRRDGFIECFEHHDCGVDAWFREKVVARYLDGLCH